MINVVIVDDERGNRDLIRAFGEWERLGMTVAGEAEDGLEAVRVIEEQAPRVVITDMRMPGADGIALLETLSARFPAVKVIVVSGYDDFHYTRHAIRHKAAEYLLKPVDAQELNAALAKCRAELEAADAGRRPAALDLELAQRLAACRQLLRHHFNDLNADGVRGAIRQLTKPGAGESDWAAGVAERIVQELLLLLGELAAANSVAGFTGRLAEAVMPATREEAEACLTARYSDALEQLLRQRKFRNKLNLDEVRTFIEHHFAEPLSLEQLAGVFFISKEYLSKAFKQEYGHSVTDHLLHLRMEKARAWLLDERLSIKAVAELAGYEDVSYFHRVFKKHYGMAPGEMRKQV